MAGKTKKARKRSRIPLSKRFKVPRKMAEDQLDRLIKEHEDRHRIRDDEDSPMMELEPLEGMDRNHSGIDLVNPDDREKGIRRDFEGNIVEIGVASGGTIKKNYAHGVSVRKAKFKDS